MEILAHARIGKYTRLQRIVLTRGIRMNGSKLSETLKTQVFYSIQMQSVVNRKLISTQTCISQIILKERKLYCQ